MKHIFDLAVIGSGPGGYIAGIRGAQLGLKTVLIEKSEIGGTCVNFGCVPTKSLLESAHFYSAMKKNRLGLNLVDFGIEEIKKLDLTDEIVKKIWDRSKKSAKKSSIGIESLFKKYGVSLIRETAMVENDHQLTLTNGDIVEFQNLIVATGSLPAESKLFPVDHRVIWDYKDALLSSYIPSSMGIIGGGVIGIEMADLFSSFGSKVTVYEALDNILPYHEEFQSKLVKSSLQKNGVKIHEKIKVINVEKNKDSAILTYEDEKNNINNEKYEIILSAIGVRPNIKNIFSESMEIITKNGFLEVDHEYRLRGYKNIFAIGDIIRGKKLAHKAEKEGKIAAEFIAGLNPTTIVDSEIPSVVYSKLQIASVGKSSAELSKKGISYKVSSFPFNALAMVTALGQNQGEIKIYYHPDKKTIYGAHIAGPLAGELISVFGIFIKNEMNLKDISSSVFPHPTVSEGIYEVINNALGKSCNF